MSDNILDFGKARAKRTADAVTPPRENRNQPAAHGVTEMMSDHPPYIEGKNEVTENIKWLSKCGFGIMAWDGPWREESVLEEIKKFAPTVMDLVAKEGGAKQFRESHYDIPVRIYAPELKWAHGKTGNRELSIPTTATAAEVDAFLRANVESTRLSEWARKFFQTLKK